MEYLSYVLEQNSVDNLISDNENVNLESIIKYVIKEDYLLVRDSLFDFVQEDNLGNTYLNISTFIQNDVCELLEACSIITKDPDLTQNQKQFIINESLKELIEEGNKLNKQKRRDWERSMAGPKVTIKDTLDSKKPFFLDAQQPIVPTFDSSIKKFRQENPYKKTSFDVHKNSIVDTYKGRKGINKVIDDPRARMRRTAQDLQQYHINPRIREKAKEISYRLGTRPVRLVEYPGFKGGDTNIRQMSLDKKTGLRGVGRRTKAVLLKNWRKIKRVPGQAKDFGAAAITRHGGHVPDELQNLNVSDIYKNNREQRYKVKNPNRNLIKQNMLKMQGVGTLAIDRNAAKRKAFKNAQRGFGHWANEYE